MEKSLLTHIDATTGSGKATISADESTVVGIVKDAIKNGRTASFYLTEGQAEAFKIWYWTPERIKSSGLRSLSDEEKERIKSELGIDVGTFRCSRIECVCGHTYGGFEFLQQGIRQHGLDGVKSVFELKNGKLLQVNTTLLVVCPNCDELLDRGIEYEGDTYAGCCCCAEQ
ncbi:MULTISPECIES: hypothetical protein [Streptomyces]|uniref:Uncharacterized protein n=1 Tax=Streptomyces doebereineriae TaxID=3075528 RepID=A0ABU2V4Z7_9ACTN|nr:hypothetical protein [Streptomyces sp. DSM 41640]MDT0480340.1 hypothetical protein [Streptomyces sp. DSM 41640]